MTSSPIKALFLDFDSTMSTPIFVERVRKWAVADNVALFRSMTAEERLANLGGPERVATLRQLLLELVVAGVTLHVISIGYGTAFGPHLQELGLMARDASSAATPATAAAAIAAGSGATAATVCPICPSRVFGQDSHELRAVKFVKGVLIGQLMAASGWSLADALFVDDSQEHVDRAATVCRTLHIAHRRGMQKAEFGAIRAAAGLGSIAG